MDPIYFARALSFPEAAAFIRGLEMRRREAWEQARYIAFFAVRPHLKDFEFKDMPRFTWELKGNNKPKVVNMEEFEVLKEFALKRDEKLLAKGKENG